MDGVEIINILPAETHLSTLAIVGIIVLAACIITLVIVIAAFVREDLDEDVAGLVISIAMIPLALSVYWVSTDRVFVPQRYEIILSDNLDGKALLQKYSIINHRGQVLVVEEQK